MQGNFILQTARKTAVLTKSVRPKVWFYQGAGMPGEPRVGDSTQPPLEATATQEDPSRRRAWGTHRLQSWPFVEETLSHVFEYCIISAEKERLPSCTIMLLQSHGAGQIRQSSSVFPNPVFISYILAALHYAAMQKCLTLFPSQTNLYALNSCWTETWLPRLKPKNYICLFKQI